MTEQQQKPAYKWHAWNPANRSQQSNWLPSAKAAKNDFFSKYPRARKCNICAGVQQGELMITRPFSDPYIPNVTKTTVLEEVS